MHPVHPGCDDEATQDTVQLVRHAHVAVLKMEDRLKDEFVNNQLFDGHAQERHEKQSGAG